MSVFRETTLTTLRRSLAKSPCPIVPELKLRLGRFRLPRTAEGMMYVNGAEKPRNTARRILEKRFDKLGASVCVIDETDGE